MAKKITEQVEKFIEDEAIPSSEKNLKRLRLANLLSCGSSMVNLACSNNAQGAFLKGRYYLIVGQSGSGKTWMYHAAFAESTLHPRFKNYRLIKDEPEHGSDFDVAFYFGQQTAERIEEAWPGRVDENNVPIPSSRTAEEFWDNVDNKLSEVEKAGTGLIYVLDSMDALTTDAFLRQTKEGMEAREKGKEAGGSYGDGKAKINSQRMRDVVNRLDKSGSFLFIICQERDNLASPVGGKTFAGGNALLFYAALQIWLKKNGTIDCQIKGKKRCLGNTTKCQIIKNRLTGQQDRDLKISYYYNFGIDDIGDMIDFLLSEKYWTGGASTISTIDAVDFEQKKNKEQLIRWLQEDEEREKKLVQIVQMVWSEIQEEIKNKTERKSKYV